MARDILGEFGRNTPQPQAGRAGNGGQIDPKPLEYCEPQGPKGINDPKSPGIHGTNHGNAVNQGKH